jgi:hypothetical protein
MRLGTHPAKLVGPERPIWRTEEEVVYVMVVVLCKLTAKPLAIVRRCRENQYSLLKEWLLPVTNRFLSAWKFRFTVQANEVGLLQHQDPPCNKDKYYQYVRGVMRNWAEDVVLGDMYPGCTEPVWDSKKRSIHELVKSSSRYVEDSWGWMVGEWGCCYQGALGNGDWLEWISLGSSRGQHGDPHTKEMWWYVTWGLGVYKSLWQGPTLWKWGFTMWNTG